MRLNVGLTVLRFRFYEPIAFLKFDIYVRGPSKKLEMLSCFWLIFEIYL